MISAIYPSANVIMRMHWAKRKKLISAWYVLLVIARIHYLPAAKGKRKVTITRYGNREMDRANAWLGADKLICDNLVSMGVLLDDSQEWLDLEVKAVKDMREKTEITIEDV